MVKAESATIYRGGGRRYLTLRSAVQAEARKIIETKYPTEKEYTSYDMQEHSPGWYWRDKLNRPEVLFRRVCRLVRAAASIGKAMPAPGAVEGGNN
ncbi:hypothetical protein [Polaromonas sp.]|uniref:hypothetical protein n=1 Tax=Polaromonas sp. TaxID=1869339 RepID=UPI0037509EC5